MAAFDALVVMVRGASGEIDRKGSRRRNTSFNNSNYGGRVDRTVRKELRLVGVRMHVSRQSRMRQPEEGHALIERSCKAPVCMEC